ncbi:MAG: hypothetical protein ACXAEU_17945 [Candidatus Hodarchaeales archaeon]|jgi:hypothetical protein
MSKKFTTLLTTLILAMIFVGITIFPNPKLVTGATARLSFDRTGSDVYIALDLAHDSDLSNIDNLKNITNTYFNSLLEISDPLTQQNLKVGAKYVDVLLILAPTVEYTEAEIDVLADFLAKGNSILFAGSPFENVSLALNGLTEKLNLSVTFSETPAPNLNQAGENRLALPLSNFNTPRIPAVENVTSFLFYNGTELSINETAINPPGDETLLKDHYSVIDNPNTGESLIYGMEFKSTITEHTLASRFIFSGSAMVFSDMFIEPVEEPGFNYYDNTEFLLGTLNWLSKVAGWFKYSDLELVDTSTRIDIGDVISVKVNLTNHREEKVDNVKVTLNLEQAGSVPVTSYMVEKAGLFIGNISTRDLSYGWFDIRVTTERRGYITLETDAIRQEAVKVFIERDPNLPQLTNISLLAALIVLTLVVVATAAVIYLDVRKIYTE